MDKIRINTILKKSELELGLNKYKYIMEHFQISDVSKNKEFQQVYRDFYQLRRFYSDEFAEDYFKIMEELKCSQEVNFKEIIERVHNIQNTFEISFSSKMLHTINPTYPIWDSVVTKKHFGIKASTTKKNREEAICQRYQQFYDAFYDYMNCDEGKALIQMFDDYFPDSEISDVKKIDFILWQDR